MTPKRINICAESQPRGVSEENKERSVVSMPNCTATEAIKTQNLSFEVLAMQTIANFELQKNRKAEKTK